MGNIFAKKLTLELGANLKFKKPEPNYNGAYPILEFMASVQTWFETLGWNESKQKLIQNSTYEISGSGSNISFLIMYMGERELSNEADPKQKNDVLQFIYKSDDPNKSPYKEISLMADIDPKTYTIKPECIDSADPLNKLKFTKSNNAYKLDLIE